MALTREQTVALARSQIGVRESPPGSNRVLYSLWYGMVAAWCAMFVSWVMARAGIGWYRFASTAASVAAARRAGRLVPVPDARPGDVMVHLYSSTLGHTGIASANGGTSTVEGNTDGGGSRTGGQVLEHRRPAGYWHYCIRLDYPTAPPSPPPPPSPPVAYPEENMQRIDQQTGLDAAGNGWVELPVTAADVVSVVPNGTNPPTGGYVPAPSFSRLDWGGKTRVVITGGPKGGRVDFSVWVAAR